MTKVARINRDGGLSSPASPMERVLRLVMDSTTDPDSFILAYQKDQEVFNPDQNRILLSKAIESNREKIISYLIPRIDLQWHQKYTVLQACSLGMKKLLINLKKDLGIKVGPRELRIAIQRNQPDILQLLLHWGVKIGESDLIEANYRGRRLVKTIYYHPQVYYQINYAWLIWSFRQGVDQMAQVAISDPQFSQCDLSLPFRIACQQGKVDLVQRMVNDPRVDPGYSFNQPLVDAVDHQHPEIVRILLESPRIDPSIRLIEIYYLALFGSQEIYRMISYESS